MSLLNSFPGIIGHWIGAFEHDAVAYHSRALSDREGRAFFHVRVRDLGEVDQSQGASDRFSVPNVFWPVAKGDAQVFLPDDVVLIDDRPPRSTVLDDDMRTVASSLAQVGRKLATTFRPSEEYNLDCDCGVVHHEVRLMLGGLIQTAVGSGLGDGRPFGKRSGCWANASASTRARCSHFASASP